MEFLRDLMAGFIIPRTTEIRDNTLIFQFDGSLYFNKVKFTKLNSFYHIELFNIIKGKIVNREKQLFIKAENIIDTFIRTTGLTHLLN